MLDKTTAGVLALLLGGFGAHKFYLGRAGAGLVYLLFCWTLIPLILGIVDGIQLLTMDPRTFNAWYNPRALPMPIVPVVPATPSPDLATQLKALHDLRVAGALTDEEFAAQKKRLLG